MVHEKAARKVLILGAGGRDFHNFNMFFRDNPDYRVVAFTAAQIPGIAGRTYPPSLSGKLYPRGIPILDEGEMPAMVKRHGIDLVVLAYSDLSYAEVMDKASTALAAGADFSLMGSKSTMLESRRPVIAVCAVRTGAGKSPVSRAVCRILKKMGRKVVVMRHPMPYGDLEDEGVQRFASVEDMEKNKCTLEEREEYEPHISEGAVVYAGVDYGEILEAAEKEADVIVWDGGNNDLPFIRPDLHIVVADAMRPGHEVSYHPGAANFRMADVIIINKVKSARQEDVKSIGENAKKINPRARVLLADMDKKADGPIKGAVLVLEDGPTLTHGGLSYGAGWMMAKAAGAMVVDPRPYAKGSIKKVFEKYPHIGPVLPAVGYGKAQMKELEATINSVPCDMVVLGTPVNLARYMKINRPVVHVKYEIDAEASVKIGKIIGNMPAFRGPRKL